MAIRRVVSDSYGSDHHPVVAIVTAATEITKTEITTKVTKSTKEEDTK
jgi:hypothetical protein